MDDKMHFSALLRVKVWVPDWLFFIQVYRKLFLQQNFTEDKLVLLCVSSLPFLEPDLLPHSQHMKFAPFKYFDLFLPILTYEFLLTGFFMKITNTALSMYSNMKLNFILDERNPTGRARKISATPWLLCRLEGMCYRACILLTFCYCSMLMSTLCNKINGP